MARRFATLGLLVVSALLCANAAAQITFTASVDKNVVAVGDTIVLTLTMAGAPQFPDPELPPLIGFDLLHDRGTRISSTFVNGVMTSSVARQYTLAPREKGNFVIGAATLRYDGTVYRTEPIQVQVVTATELPQEVPTQAENLFATLSADKGEAFLGEQVNLYLRLYFRQVGLVGEPSIEGPDTDAFVRYDLPTRRFRTKQDRFIYEVAELPVVLFPLKTGEIKIPAVVITGQVRVQARRRSRTLPRGFDDFFSDDFFFDRYTVKQYRVSTDPVTILVKPLPKNNKPDDFAGNVGSYSLETYAKPSQVKVGEPITVTMRVAGSGNLEALNAPVLSDIDNFKTYEPEITTDIVAKEPVFMGQRTFEMILVPQRPGRQVIRNVKFNFFDPEKEKYVTLAKGSFEFDVLPAPVEPMRRVVQVETGSGKTEIKVVGEDIAPIFSTARRAANVEPVGGIAFSVSLAAPALAYAALLAAVARKRRLASDVAYARKQRATRDARRRLAAATRALKRGEGAGFYGEVAKAITGFVADKTGMPPAGLTAGDVREKLDSAGVPDDLLNRVASILEACDYWRFAASAHKPPEMKSMLDSAKYVLSELQKVLGRPSARDG